MRRKEQRKRQSTWCQRDVKVRGHQMEVLLVLVEAAPGEHPVGHGG
jgi:hypothetical protein